MWRKRNRPDSGTSKNHTGGKCREESGEDSVEAEAEAVSVAVVRDKAMFLLAGREHGRLELRQKLVQRQYPPPLIDSVLDELAERGLQCDVRFAESYTRMRVNRGYGANKIRADLQAKKLTRDIVEQAIIENDADWDENAHAALIKKFAVSDCIEMPDNYKEKVAYIGKMTRFLQARGYGSQQIAEALKRVSTRTA